MNLNVATKTILVSLISISMLLLGHYGYGKNQIKSNHGDVAYGLTASQFTRFSELMSGAEDRIVNVRFLDGTEGGYPGSIAVLMQNKFGKWKITVFDRKSDGSFRAVWIESHLDDSFSVSSPQNFNVASLDGHDLLMFSGCAAHVCQDIFSTLIYDPSKHEVYSAKYEFGKIKYSENLTTSINSKYKYLLKKEINDKE